MGAGAGASAGDGKEVDHSDWCAFGVDVAGTNLRRDFVNITRPAQCDDICRRNATGCTFWIFVASRPEQTQLQQERNCFAKADVFKGENGWTGKPKADIWNADSQVGTGPCAVLQAMLCVRGGRPRHLPARQPAISPP